MSSSEEIIVAEVQVGDSRKHLSEKITVRVVFNDFATLPHQVGQETESPMFSSHGREWLVAVYPGGFEEEDDGNVGVFLHLRSEDRNVKAKFSLRIPAANESETGVRDFKDTSIGNGGCGWSDFCPRDSVLSSLGGDGALVVFADIQIYAADPPKWVPNMRTFRHDIATLFETTQFKDVTFSVGDTTFEAHRLILLARAPALAALAENDSTPGTIIPLNDAAVPNFKAFLRFLYTCEAPSNIKSDALQFLEMADRFGCVHLKLLAESELETSLSSENAADLLLLADGKNCALLKESALFFIAMHQREVMVSAGWTKLSKSASLLTEIMTAQIEPASSTEDNESDLSKMRVAKLRNLLEEQGLDVDGSKEMLVKRLEEVQSEGTDKTRTSKRGRIA